jgi:hypothetical protein
MVMHSVRIDARAQKSCAGAGKPDAGIVVSVVAPIRNNRCNGLTQMEPDMAGTARHTGK